MGEVGVHLDDQLGAAGRARGGSRPGRRGRGPPCAGRCRTSTSSSPAAIRSAISPGPVGRASSTTRIRRRSGSCSRTAATKRLDVAGLVVGRQDEPDGSAGLGHLRILCGRACAWLSCPDDERRDRRRAGRAGDPLRARRRDQLPGDRLPHGGAGDPREPGLGRRAGAAGRATELPGIGKTLQEKIVALIETGEIPSAEKLKAKFPADADRGDPDPGAGREDRPAPLRRARRDHARGPAGGRRGPADPRAQGPRAEGRGERSRGARAARRTGRGPERLLLSTCSRSPRSSRPRCASTPPAKQVEVAGLGAALDRDLQGHRPDRDRRATRRPWRAPRRAPADRRAGSAGPQRRRDQTHNGVSVDLRIVAPEAVRQPAAALHRLGTHNVALREAAVARGPLGLRARDHRHRSGEVDPLRDRGGGL